MTFQNELPPTPVAEEDLTETLDPNVRYFIASGIVCKLTRSQVDNTWHDEFDTVYALVSRANESDAAVKCGVGWFSLPESSMYTGSCAPHDMSYSSSAYMLFNNKSEADEELERRIRLADPTIRGSLVGRLFHILVGLGGRFFWNNKATNDEGTSHIPED